MATVTLQFAGTQTATNSVTVSDADVLRLLNAERTLRNLPTATNAQICALISQDVFSLLKMRCRTGEQQAAQNSVSDIAIT